MVWDPKTNRFDPKTRPDPITVGRVHMVGLGILHHRIPWSILCGVLNDILSGTRDSGVLNSLLSLGPSLSKPLVDGFKAAATLVKANKPISATAIAALDLVEQEIFSLPCNLFLGPPSRADDPGAGLDFTAVDVDGNGLPRPGVAQLATTGLTPPVLAARLLAARLGDLQRAREKTFCALVTNDDVGLGLATAEWIKLWTDPNGYAATRATATDYVAAQWMPSVHPIGPYRAMTHDNGVALTIAESAALNGIVETRARTKYRAVYQLVAGPSKVSTSASTTTPRLARTTKRYGWLPDFPDARDRRFFLAPGLLDNLPASVDLRPTCPPVYNQGALGSCTGNAIAAAIQFNRLKQEMAPDFVPSRLFIYYNERVLEQTVSVDAGAQIRDGIKCVAASGVCTEDEWPYDVTKFAQRPPDGLFQDALQTTALNYDRLGGSETDMKGCLASGHPFIVGISVYESFESHEVTTSGIVPMPNVGQERLLGGHAVLAVGYDDDEKHFIIRNSWGPDWGLKGYFKIPYAYLTNPNLCDDMWTIRIVGAADRTAAVAAA